MSRAISVIGMRELRALIIATAAIEIFSRMPTDLVDMETFWRHSIYTGVIARELASRCNVLHSERLFVTGLLHDVGSLIMYNELPVESMEALNRYKDSGKELFEIEQEVVGFDHASVGKELLQNWNLPDATCMAVAYHHEPEKAEKYHLEAAIVHLANIMTDIADDANQGNADSVCCGSYVPLIRAVIRKRREQEDYKPPFSSKAWEVTGLDENCIESVIADAKYNYEKAMDLLYYA